MGQGHVQPLDRLILFSKGVSVAAENKPEVVDGETHSGQNKDKSHEIFLDSKI